MFLNDEFNKIKKTIIEAIPKDASVSDIEFEGPEIAIYSRNPRILLDNGEIDPTFLTSDKDLQGRIRQHPLLEWKALNVREHRGK